MASPAVTSPPHRALDPTKKAHFTVRIGDKLTKGNLPRRGYTSVKLNHKPTQKGQDRTSRITSSEKGTFLTIEDKDTARPGKYTYKGQRINARNSYVLVFDPEKQTCTLEPVSANYNFNLRSTPWESSAGKLTQQYPQIPLNNDANGDGEDDLFDGDSADEGDNPYDYRNFMASDRGREGSQSASPPMTARLANTPQIPAARKIKSTAPIKKATAQASQEEQKAKAKVAASRKPKSPPLSSTTTSSKPPKIQVERRASTRPIEEAKPKQASPPASPPDSPSSPDGFEIDYGDSLPEKHKPRGLGLALLEHASGPISLRSVANSASPSSRLHTPQHPKSYDNEDIDFGQLGGDDDDDDEIEEEDLDADGEADYDVEPINIGPPAQEQVPGPTEEEDDDDADFEEAMMEGMAEESESESEEE